MTQIGRPDPLQPQFATPWNLNAYIEQHPDMGCVKAWRQAGRPVRCLECPFPVDCQITSNELNYRGMRWQGAGPR